MKRAVVLLLLYFLNSCNMNDNFINSFSSNQLVNSNVLIPITLKLDGVLTEVVVYNEYLYNQIFKIYYTKHYPTYAEFLHKVLKRQLIIEAKFQIYIIYDIDSSSQLFREYNKGGVDYIREKYLIEKNQRLKSNKELEWEDRGALIKIMFLEKFYSFEDDYSGTLIFLKEIDINDD